MCHFITAVLPSSAAHGELDALARLHGRRFQPMSTPSIEAQIGPGERYFSTTVGHCDCGTPLGALARGGAPDWEAQAQRLRKKGWSGAKVARSLAQKKADFDASAAPEGDTRAWLDFIRAVLDSGMTSHLGLLLHMYSGSLDAPIELAGRETVRTNALTVELLGHMREDVLYVFQR